MNLNVQPKKKLGSICAGIGGFDLGFQRAGWETEWCLELDDVNRAVIADRFAPRGLFKDLRYWRSYSLSAVDCIAFGFPCQDISIMGASRAGGSRVGLEGNKSGLFHEIMEIVREIQPAWLVIENVPALLHCNACEDFGVVISKLAECGYVGFFRVLNGQYFGIPQNRRRIFLVAGLGRFPSMEFLADARAVECVSASLGSSEIAKCADAWAGYTLTAPYNRCNSRINLGSELFVVEEDGWDSMVERARASGLHGIPKGLDATNIEEAFSAGNAVCPQIAEWIAGILNKS